MLEAIELLWVSTERPLMLPRFKQTSQHELAIWQPAWPTVRRELAHVHGGAGVAGGVAVHDASNSPFKLITSLMATESRAIQLMKGMDVRNGGRDEQQGRRWSDQTTQGLLIRDCGVFKGAGGKLLLARFLTASSLAHSLQIRLACQQKRRHNHVTDISLSMHCPSNVFCHIRGIHHM